MTLYSLKKNLTNDSLEFSIQMLRNGKGELFFKKMRKDDLETLESQLTNLVSEIRELRYKHFPESETISD